MVEWVFRGINWETRFPHTHNIIIGREKKTLKFLQWNRISDWEIKQLWLWNESLNIDGHQYHQYQHSLYHFGIFKHIYSRPIEVYSLQPCVEHIVTDLWQVCDFLLLLPILPLFKITAHNMTHISLNNFTEWKDTTYIIKDYVGLCSIYIVVEIVW